MEAKTEKSEPKTPKLSFEKKFEKKPTKSGKKDSGKCSNKMDRVSAPKSYSILLIMVPHQLHRRFILIHAHVPHFSLEPQLRLYISKYVVLFDPNTPVS